MELMLHLQGVGKFVRAMDIVEYKPDVKAHLNTTKTISLATAQRWMKVVGFQWTKIPSSQFVNGHEQDNVVAYRQTVFLPVWAEFLECTRIYNNDGYEYIRLRLSACRVIVWNHDECTYYANDRCLICWVHQSKKAVPYAKGEGASIMVADFISPDYGWLHSPDGTFNRGSLGPLQSRKSTQWIFHT
jgi:hypothetical protein